MGKRRPLRERPKRERWLSKKQYEMLRRCSAKKDVTEWNDWRVKHPRMPVFLEGADLAEAHLEGADFRGAHLERAKFGNAHLKGADFTLAHLERADLSDAHLEGARFWFAHVEGARFSLAHLEGADLSRAHLEGAGFGAAHLEGADFGDAHLKGADLLGAYLEGAKFRFAHLEGAGFMMAHLEGADFWMAAVDGGTLLLPLYVDRQTNFTGVGLESARVAPGVKPLLEYNVRRLGWEGWYKEHPVAQWPVRLFWAMSDYGRSTGRILGCFFSLAAAFALVYYVCSLVWPPGIVSNLLDRDNIPVPGWLLPFRALYFSIVTMTTLGFGDIYAYPNSLAGHLLLTLQVLLGYVLLAALVTRFAVLFTAGGPAWKFPDE